VHANRNTGAAREFKAARFSPRAQIYVNSLRLAFSASVHIWGSSDGGTDQNKPPPGPNQTPALTPPTH